MLQEPLSEKEIQFCEAWYSPTALTECLIPVNIKAPHLWKNADVELIRIRNYQFAMQNYSYMYANDDTLTSKQNFQNKKLAGDLINIAARAIGKSFFLIIDAFLVLLHGIAGESCLASFDHKHLMKICKPVSLLANFHPFFQMFKRKGKSGVRFTGGGMEIDTMIGHTMYGKNEKVGEKDPGTDFHSLHYNWLGYDEASYMSKQGTEKRIDSIDPDVGSIEKISGIPDIRIDSPLGKILSEPKNKNIICRLPQYVMESWDSITRQEKIDFYNGESSYAFKLNVLGEIIEGASGFWDMPRLRKACRYGVSGTNVKFFEIDQKKYHKLDQILILDRLPCQQAFCCSDIGTTGSPSEIIIIFYDGERYKYYYNIALYKLTTHEQAKVFAWIYERLGGAYIALDSTNSDGRSIADDLRRDTTIPADEIIEVKFNAMIEVGILEDEVTGKPIRDNSGNVLMKEERTIDWAMTRLEKLFYGEEMEIPTQEKFISSFSDFIVKQTGMRRTYGTLTGDDHLHQSMQVFAIAQFLNEFRQQVAKPRKKDVLVHFLTRNKICQMYTQIGL